MAKALTGIDDLANPEALHAGEPHAATLVDIDYSSIPQTPLTREEFEQELPWIYTGVEALPEGFEIVGFARAYYPDDLKELLLVYQQHPGAPIRDYVITISDGKRCHYIGVSDGAKDGVIRSYHINIHYVSNAAAVIINGQPICVFSASDFFTPEQQLQMLLGLFWLFDVGFLEDL